MSIFLDVKQLNFRFLDSSLVGLDGNHGMSLGDKVLFWGRMLPWHFQPLIIQDAGRIEFTLLIILRMKVLLGIMI